jgi:hypothetical protein
VLSLAMDNTRAFIKSAMNAVWRAYDTLEIPEPARSVQTQTIKSELFVEVCPEPEETESKNPD